MFLGLKWFYPFINSPEQEIAEKASGIISQIEDVQTDTEDLFEHP